MNLDSFKNERLSNNLKTNLNYIKNVFKKDDILRIREFYINSKIKCALFFFDGMVNSGILNESVLEPLLEYKGEITTPIEDLILDKIIFAAESSKTQKVDEMLRSIQYGDTLLIADGSAYGITINTKGWRTRGISEPVDEKVLQGPREGFDEAVMLNMAMIRRKLPTPDLCVETFFIGRSTDTRVFVTYLDSIVNKKALNILKERLAKIKIDGILDTNYIAELINPDKVKLFKTIGSTERPDIVAARLLEGRIALLVDGSPVVLTLPYLFTENFQSDDDYYLNHRVAVIGRILRYFCFFLSISVPSVFLALITHHKHLLPTPFFITTAASRDGVPFTAITECLVLIFIFEILRETGLRTPQGMGHALSIVGGLVVGQAAVSANIVSAPMLIIVALSGVSGLMVARLKGAVFYSRIGLVLLGNYFGLFGYFTGIFTIFILAFSLESFSVDSTSDLLTADFQSIKDTFIRTSWKNMITRPIGISENKVRQKDIE
ncbi:MAG: spore germination protein [Ruminococcaceae bacterium]|nr:spore germination protein [Oscillospiraceae bacterium]